MTTDEGTLIAFYEGLVNGAYSLGYVSCTSKKGNTPVSAGTDAFDFRL